MTAAPGVVSELLEVGAVGDERAGRRALEAPLDLVRKADLGDLYAESGQTLQGSSSAVSKPIFQSKNPQEEAADSADCWGVLTVLHSARPAASPGLFVLEFMTRRGAR